jgi:hypothetical protein
MGKGTRSAAEPGDAAAAQHPPGESDRRLLSELHAHRPARGSRAWIQQAMKRRSSSASQSQIDAMIRTMRREGCSICGERPNAHIHEAHAREEHRPGEPCVVGYAGGERVAVACPYCGEERGSVDQGWVPADFPHRVYAECCGGGWYELTAGKRRSGVKTKRSDKPSTRMRR